MGRGAPLAASLAVLAAACIPTSPKDRSDLHDELVRRTGAGVGAEFRARPEIPEGVALADGLTEDEAVALALWNNPDLQVTLSDLGFAKADLYQAGSLPNPLFSTFLPLGPKQLEMTIFQTITALWQRPYRVAAAKADVERVAEQLVAAGLDTVRATRIAYAELDLALRRQALLEAAAETWGRMSTLAQVRLDAGAASELERTAVATDARAAAVEAARQAREVEARTAELAALALVPPASGAALDGAALQPAALPEGLPPTPELLKTALAARPEVRAAEMSMEAAGERVGLARAEIFDIIFVLDSNSRGIEGFEVGPGLQATLPIFHQNQAGRARAQAEIERGAWQYLAARARVTREVRAAAARYGRARAALSVWPDEVVTPLEQNERRAERAYAAGGATYLQVLEATRRLIAARVQGLDLEREAWLAWADLRRAAGGGIR